MTTTTRVQLERVRKQYENGHVAVAGATFEAGADELIVLVGPSGCGKSTLLRMVAGLESISSGTVSIGGRVVNDVAPKDRDVAMVFQSYALYPHMTVAENMAFGLMLRGESRTVVEARVTEAAGLLGLESMLERKPRQLSGGQRQRVALGRALVRQPQVFLLDEPLSNLDARLRMTMRTEIARLHRRLATTMLYVTHDQVEAMTLGHRIVVMNAGEIQQIDTPLAIYARPANVFVATFLGSPAMNLFRGCLALDGGPRLIGDGLVLDIAGAAPDAVLRAHVDREIVVGVRPEHLAPVSSPLDESTRVRLDASVETVEPVGHEAFVNARAAGTDVAVRVAPDALPAPGAQIVLGCRPEDLHLFDASGNRIG